MNIIKLILKTAFVVIIVGSMLYWAQIYPIVPIFGAGVIILGGMWLASKVEYFRDWDGPVILSGTVVYFAAIFLPLTPLRIVHHDNSVSVLTQLYPLGKVLARGSSIDTLHNMASNYYRDENIKINHRDLYLVHGDTTDYLFNDLNLIVTGHDMTFNMRDLGHGMLHTCRYIDNEGKDREVDLDGHNVNDAKYSPKVTDIEMYYNSY
mgnify:CR=1 FL=1